MRLAYFLMIWRQKIVLEKHRQQVSYLKIFSLSKQFEDVELMLNNANNSTELERQSWILIKKSN
jgi:hypothetical protein